MSHQTPAPRVPAGVTTGGQFTATARGESPVELDTRARADRQARIATAMREAATVAESYGAADLRGVQSRAAFGVNLADYVTEARAALRRGAGPDSEVDTFDLLDRGLLLLEETGAHQAFVNRARRERYSGQLADGDPTPAALVDDVTDRIASHLALADAVLHSPLAGSEGLARSRFARTGTGDPSVVLPHTEFVPSAGGRQNVVAIRTPAGTIEMWAGGQRVVGLGEHLAWSSVVAGSGTQATGSRAATALAAVLAELA